jgi:hypothetical protein
VKSLSTLALIGLLFFACKLCSFTGNNNKPPPTPTPTPQPLMYAADFLKTKLGQFTLTKIRTRDELLKTTSSEPSIRKIIEKASDSALGSYESEKRKPALIWIFSFPTPEVAASQFDDFEKDMRVTRWRNLKTTNLAHGRRIEGTDSKSRAAVIWTNGYWLFWAWSGDPALTDSLVDSVGY